MTLKMSCGVTVKVYH